MQPITVVMFGFYFRLHSVSTRVYRFFVMNIESASSASVYVPPGHVKRLGKLLPNQNAKLKDQFHEVARFKYLSGRTEGTYWQCHVAAPEDGRTPSESCFHAKAHFQTGS